MTEIFTTPSGIIVACDVPVKELDRLIEQTHDVEGVVGYKLGRMHLGGSLPIAVRVVRNHTDKPIILDPQKEGNDVEFTEPGFIRSYAKDGIKNLIIFPFSGPRVQAVCVRACYDNGITPIGGFTLTQRGFSNTETVTLADLFPELGQRQFRGYISGDAEKRALELYALLAVNHFIGPGNKPDELTRMLQTLGEYDVQPRVLMPGIGRQGGDIETAIQTAKDNGAIGCYAIIGSAIYGVDDPKIAAQEYSNRVMRFM